MVAWASPSLSLGVPVAVPLFEPFFTTKPDGTGLGLATTRKIIEGHGGTLRFDSCQGKGTTVTITLPMHKGETK